MKEDTIFVFTVTNFFSFSFFPIKYFIRKLFNRIDKKEELLQYFVTEGNIKKHIKHAGLRILSFKKLNLLSFNPLVQSLVKTNDKAKKILKFDSILSKIPIVNNFFDTFIFAVRLDK